MPMQRKFTPKQVAQALGVSESSIKRWVDSGKLEAVKTAGGHRKLPLAAVVKLAREQGYAIVRPELLGLAAEHVKCRLEDACEPLVETLAAGDESASQAIIEPLYHAGHSMVEIADQVIAPVFHEIGHRWARGEFSVHQERRACEIAIATLHNLRRMLPLPEPGAPRAIVTTPSDDHAELPSRLAELVLREKGWDARVLGISLPLDEIRAAVEKNPPDLALLSATHLDNANVFVTQANNDLFIPTAGLTRWIVGGQAFGSELQPLIACHHFSRSMHSLAKLADEYVSELHAQGEAN
ncbi:helix-turn-helix domain-containing protein [Aeoliella sp. SH292]|uniref:helix-turn-helix domain-containing protein n=1 Tax=Aeoliella sp. SH292 TaxID=3454464 RepID=UPI003F9D072A